MRTFAEALWGTVANKSCGRQSQTTSGFLCQENTSYASVVAAEGSQIVLSCGVADDSERRRVQRIDRAMAHSGVCTQPGTVAMKTYRMSDG
ncbi:unnamed protein product [Lampetra fluviatilis]